MFGPTETTTPTRTASEQMIRDALGTGLSDISAIGSRVSCDPPPVDTDEDWLVLINRDPKDALRAAGFRQDGNPDFYTGTDKGSFRSWRRGDVNIVTTPDVHFYDLFITATMLAKRFNLMKKPDRIALFQAVLYGVRWGNLHQPEALVVDCAK